MIRLIFLAVAVISALLTVGAVLAVAHSWRLGPWRERPTCAPWDHHLAGRHRTRRVTRYIGRPHVVDTAPVYSDADYELAEAEYRAEQAAWESFCADNADVAQACRELTEETR